MISEKSINELSQPKTNLIEEQLLSVPLSEYFDSECSGSSLEREQILEMQVKQLKRQNQFLKKKIKEITNSQGISTIKKKKYIGKGITKDDLPTIELSVDFFFQEINNLIHQIGNLFKVELTINEMKSIKPNPTHKQKQKNGEYFSKNWLVKQLQKIGIQAQENRYPLLLNLFASYYRNKQELQKRLNLQVDDMCSRLLELNKAIYEKACKRRSSTHGSCVKETPRTQKITLDIPHKNWPKSILFSSSVRKDKETSYDL